MLIRNAEIWGHGLGDVRVISGLIAAIGNLAVRDSEKVLDARGGLLIPGLHDHHIHISALAATNDSVPCGPPHVSDETALANALARPGEGWLRGIGYHESVAGLLDVTQLDRMSLHRPVRIQHRSGRLWFLNSAALALLLEAAPPPPGLEHHNGQWTGRLFDADNWVREALGSNAPAFAEVSLMLAKLGITGITDLSPSNDLATAAHFSAQQLRGNLKQRCVLGGALALDGAKFDAQLMLGPAKLHLHESALPDFDDTVRFIERAHRQERPVAIHCVTETELAFALAALRGGTKVGDRIEHASVAPDHLVADMAALNLHVVTQPHFLYERGDRYILDVEACDQPFLYRLASLQSADIVLGGGSDAPFGSHDPWIGMRAAVTRRTACGAVIGTSEALTPEQALSLYLADPLNLTRERTIAVGEAADLCLLDRPWAEARDRLDARDVRATIIAGSIVHNLVDQSPVKRHPYVDSTS